VVNKILVTSNCPEEKQFRATSFVIHATRGVIRDQKTRRQSMVITLILALLLLFSGSTFLQPFLNPHEHPARFVFFWIICGWFTIAAILLAIFDLIMMRLEARRQEQSLREELRREARPNSGE
jgi:protein-S-isoprenylcysteine O-methyltransferase Ste14